MQLAISIAIDRSAYAFDARIKIDFIPFLFLQTKKKLLTLAVDSVVPPTKIRVIIAGFTKNLP
jgi:hypothetical protein